MVAVAAPPRTTQDRLLDAAERLVAERGLAATSVRSVCAAAGANVAAVHYHFGSKESLVEAILERRMGELTTRRLAMLEPLESQARPSTRGVVDALVRPLADFAREPDRPGRAYVRFLAALDAAGERDRIALAFMPQYERLAPALERSLPAVASAVIAFRLDFVSGPLLATLAQPDLAVRHWNGAPPLSYDDLVDALVDAVTGTLTGGTNS
jgi:AcrR family transcriptional regulator